MKENNKNYFLHALPKRMFIFLLAVTIGLSTACTQTPVSSETSEPNETKKPISENKKAIELSSSPITENEGWKDYINDSKGDYVYPKSVTVEGNVEEVRNPEGILSVKSSPEVGEIGESVSTISSGFLDEDTTTISTTADGSSRIVVDLGVTTGGYVELGVVSASGAPIRMSYSEYLPCLGKWGDGNTDPDADYYQYGMTEGPDDDPDGRADVFPPPLITPPKTYNVLISPGIRGSQRYIAITLDGEGTATLDFVRIHKTYFRASYDGNFICNDEVLNRAWYASAYNIDLSTAKDTRFNPEARWIIMDGPKRDRTVWNCDLRIVGQSAFYQGEAYFDIYRDCLNLFAVQQIPDGTLPFSSRTDVPFTPYEDPGSADGMVEGYEDNWTQWLRLDSFTIWWVVQLGDYLQYSGDIEFVENMMPVARRIMKFVETHTEKDSVLFLTDNYDEKWGMNWHTPDAATGVEVYANEAYYGALMAMANMERIVANDEAEANSLEDLAEQVKTELVEKFWDDEAGAMLCNSNSPKPDHPADCNVGALLFGILDEEKAKRAIEHLNTKLQSPYGTLNSEFEDNPYMSQYISPYIMATQAVAFFKNDAGQDALDLIRKAWGHMLDVGGTGTIWEEVGLNGLPETARETNGLDFTSFLDLSHAWSTSIPALSMNVVGVQPVTEGYTEYSVDPKPLDLEWAQGAVPVPDGYINVRWQRGSDDKTFVMTVEAPDQYTGAISVPTLGGNYDIAIDGTMAWSDGKAVNGFEAEITAESVVFIGISGDHTFAWSAES